MKNNHSAARLLQTTCLVALVTIFIFQNTSFAFAQSSPFANLSANTASPALYDLYEISFDLPTTYTGADRFNPNLVEVWAAFTLPDGTVETMPGFFKQEQSPQWAIRYAPRLAGEYQVTLTLTDVSGTQTESEALTFTTGPARNSGFIEIDPRNPARLRTTNGDGFVMIGVNTAWEDDLYNRDWDFGMVQAFDAMQAYNMNFGRVFGGALWTAYFLEASGTQRERGYARLYEGLGNYQLDAARDGDDLFQNAQDRHLHLSYVLLEHLAFAKGYQWERNAYNAVNGGPCEATTCFWTDPIAKEYIKRLMRYTFARYGSYTSSGFLEFWNEVDNGTHNMWTPETQADVFAWHAEMDAYWKSLDIYHHPTTTSYAWRDHQWPEDYNQHANSWPAMPYFDVVNQHRYPSNFGTVTVETWVDQISWMQTSGDKIRPAFIGEYGVVGESATVRDPQGYYFHDGAWVPFFFAEAAGTNLIWRVDALFRPHSPTSDGYRAFGAFICPEFGSLPAMKFFPPETVTANVQVGKYASAERALLFFRDFEADPVKNNGRNQPTAEIGAYTLNGLQDGDYLIEYWHTMTGEILATVGARSTSGKLTFTAPPFQRALAVKIYPGMLVSTPVPIIDPTATQAPPIVVTLAPTPAQPGSSPSQIDPAIVPFSIFVLMAAVALFWFIRRKKG